MRSGQTTGFTGQQNTGKTTMMKAAIEFVINLNIRVLEMSFELALREIYPSKNIFTVKPTDYITSSEIQDTLKKTDGWLSMVGEVAEDIVAARMIQFSLVGSDFTMFSHHGKDDDGLINGLANSLVASGEYENHEVAISTVLDAVKNNVHLAFIKGERVIEYISEIVKEDEIAPYPDIFSTDNMTEALMQLVAIQKEYYTRRTDRVRFTSRQIIRFNQNTMSYEPGEWYTPETFKKMLNKMTRADQEAFIAFKNEYWPSNVVVSEEVDAS
jgi:pilus assembly protein CpaF